MRHPVRGKEVSVFIVAIVVSPLHNLINKQGKMQSQGNWESENLDSVLIMDLQ